MSNDTSIDSPLERAAGAAGPRAIEAFEILGNKTRLSILLALWEAYEPFAADNTVPFSELRERVGMRDSGQFSYHLDKLAGHFVDRGADGYELRRAGYQLVGTVIAGTGIEEPTLEPTEIDQNCSHCGATAAVTYEDGKLYLVCTECEGNWERSELDHSGVLAAGDFEPAGLTDRTPEQAWNAMSTAFKRQAVSAAEGVCVVCSGPTAISVDICEEHASAGLCDNCGREWAITARERCPVCKNHETGPPFYFVARHPAVIGFFYDRGAPLQYDRDGASLTDSAVQELVSEQPPRLQVAYEYEGDRLEMLVDQELNVLEVTEPD